MQKQILWEVQRINPDKVFITKGKVFTKTFDKDLSRTFKYFDYAYKKLKSVLKSKILESQIQNNFLIWDNCDKKTCIFWKIWNGKKYTFLKTPWSIITFQVTTWVKKLTNFAAKLINYFIS